jgi:hypothetical protein
LEHDRIHLARQILSFASPDLVVRDSTVQGGFYPPRKAM